MLQSGSCTNEIEHLKVRNAPTELGLQVVQDFLMTKQVFWFRSMSLDGPQSTWPSYQANVLDLGAPLATPLNPIARGFPNASCAEAVENALRHYEQILEHKKTVKVDKIELEKKCFEHFMNPDEIFAYDEMRLAIELAGEKPPPALHNTCECKRHQEGRISQQYTDYEDFLASRAKEKSHRDYLESLKLLLFNKFDDRRAFKLENKHLIEIDRIGESSADDPGEKIYNYLLNYCGWGYIDPDDNKPVFKTDLYKYLPSDDEENTSSTSDVSP